MYRFGRSSTERLAQLHPDLRSVLTAAIQVKDFSIIEGYRDRETQDRYFDTGVSHLQFPDSLHNRNPALAVDIWPFVTHIGGVKVNAALNGSRQQIAELALTTGLGKRLIEDYIKEEFHLLQGVVMGIAHSLGIKLRFGLDWNGNCDRMDQKLHDLPHLELA